MIAPDLAPFAAALDPRRARVPERPSRRQADRRAAIFAATRGLLADGGAAHLTLRRIAARSGSTAPTIYSLVGNRHAVIEEALLDHLDACIAIAPEIASRLGLNAINGFSDSLWLSAQVCPAYLRRQVLFVRHGLEGRRLGALFAQRTTGAIEGWVRELCGRSRLAKRIGHEEIAAAIEAQLRTALLDWAEGNESAPTMRRKLARAPAICLSRFIEEQEMSRLATWLASLGEAPAIGGAMAVG